MILEAAILRVARGEESAFEEAMKIAEPLGMLHNSPAMRGLAGKKKGFDQLAIAANGHPGKGFIPCAFRDLGFRVKPASEQFELGGMDFTRLNAVKQVLEQCGRKMVPAYLRHDLPPQHPGPVFGRNQMRP